MAESDAWEESAIIPEDFMAGLFLTRDEPIQFLIHTLSNLYLDPEVAERSEEELEDSSYRAQNLATGGGRTKPHFGVTHLFHLATVLQALEEHHDHEVHRLSEQVQELEEEQNVHEEACLHSFNKLHETVVNECQAVK